MARKEIRIVATNGKWTKEFMYFVQGPKGDIYYGTLGHEENRTSIHSSGVSHTRTGKLFIPHGKGKKPSEIRGLRQLFSMSIGRLVFESPFFGKTFLGSKADGFVLFDTRKYKTDIGIMFFLLEAAHADELNKLLKIIHEPQFFVFTQTEPWLVVAIHSYKQQNQSAG